MKIFCSLLAIMLVAILTSCNQGDSTAIRGLNFGTTLEEAKSKGYLASNEKTISEEGLDTYQCQYSDFEGMHYERAELSFRNGKLAKVLFVNTTTSAEQQRALSRKVIDYLNKQCGVAKELGKFEGWKDDKRTYLLRVHSEVDSNMTSTYYNELAVCSNEFYKQ